MTKTIRAADLFCGAGGTSTGLVEACQELGYATELTAINHWNIAIATHSENHPKSRHLCAHLDGINPRDLYKEGELDLLWASPECTHHSIARGGKPVNEQSRATAWCVARWAEALRPPIILVENVKEFLSWGPIGSNGTPLASKRGEVFHSWVNCLGSLGYRVGWRVLCAADYGDPTTRERLFIYAVRGRRRIVWPEPSHTEVVIPDMFSQRLRWLTARDHVIDWSIPGKSIFNRKRPLAEKTIRRIMIGLERFKLKPFTVHMEHGGSVRDINRPIPTVTTARGGAVAVVNPFFVKSGAVARKVSDPLPTVATAGAISLCEPFITKFYGSGICKSVCEPLDSVTTKDRFGLVMPSIEIDGEKYQIDIRFRMLEPHELAAAQGFPKDYKFTGNKTEIVKQIGNAVPKNLAKALVKSALTQSP